MSKFRSFYPFDFQLLNKSGEHAFFIEDEAGSITLSIINKGGLPLYLRVQEDQNPGDGYHHFTLRFRPGTLLHPENINLDHKDWELAHSKFHGMDVLAFTLKHDAPETARQIESGGDLQLSMTDFLADRRTGARETSVELISDHLYNDNLEQLIKATRIVKWPIINHRGYATIPVHVDFLGSNTILNNGDPNELTLRVSLLNDKASLTFLHHLDDNEKSKIIISFDEGSNQDEWNIADNETAHSFQFSTSSSYLETTKIVQGATTLFTVSCSKKEVLFGRQFIDSAEDADHIPEYFDIIIKNIITKHPSGKTNCYIRFENIPGFWDNSFIVPIEKQPLIFRSDKVGIGKIPAVTLDVAGNVIADGNLTVKKELYVEENAMVLGKMVVKNWLLVEDKVNVNGDIRSGFGRIQDKTGDVMPVGAIIAYGGIEVPDGWLICDNKYHFKKDYPDLYKKLGSPPSPNVDWAKKNGVYFYCPDLRSRFIVGAGQGTGLSNYYRDTKGGEEKHTLTIPEMPSHDHGYFRAKWATMQWKAGHRDPFWTDNGNDKYDKPKTGNTGSNEPHNNLPPYYALTYIIKC